MPVTCNALSLGVSRHDPDAATTEWSSGRMQVKAGTAATPLKQQQAPTRPAPVINPVGASSNYTNKGLTSVNKSPAATQGNAVAAPSSSRADSDFHMITGEHVDQAHLTEAKKAADEPPAELNTSQLDKPGLSGPQENALPGYQVINLLLFAWCAVIGEISQPAGKPPKTTDVYDVYSPFSGLHRAQTLHHNLTDCGFWYISSAIVHKQHCCSRKAQVCLA